AAYTAAANSRVGKAAKSLFTPVATAGASAAASAKTAFNKEMKGASKGVTALGGSFKGMAGTASAAIAAIGLYSLGKSAFQAATGIEQSNAALKGLYGSGRVAKSVMDQLYKTSQGSPISYQAFLNGAESLAYLGVEGKKVNPILKQIETGLVAAGSGSEEMESVTSALLGMANQGKASADQLMRISDAGFPIFEMMAAHAGTSIEQVRKSVEKGKVSIDDVMAAIQAGQGKTFGKMKKAYEESSKTFSATWQRASSGVVAAMGKAAAPILQKFTPAINSAGEKVTSFFDNISKGKAGGGSKVLKDLGNYAEKLGNKLKPAVKPLQNMWDALKTLGGPLKDFGNTIKTAVAPILEKLAGAIGSGIKDLANIISGTLVPAFKQILPI